MNPRSRRPDGAAATRRAFAAGAAIHITDANPAADEFWYFDHTEAEVATYWLAPVVGTWVAVTAHEGAPASPRNDGR